MKISGSFQLEFFLCLITTARKPMGEWMDIKLQFLVVVPVSGQLQDLVVLFLWK
jgi:hypothetical protein